MADPTLDPVPPRVSDRRTMPAGVVPRHLQQWGVIGIATVMVAVLALSGPPAKSQASYDAVFDKVRGNTNDHSLSSLHSVKEFQRHDGGYVIMENNKHLEVSQRKRKDFLDAIQDSVV